MPQKLNARYPGGGGLGEPIAQIIRLIREGSQGEHGAI